MTASIVLLLQLIAGVPAAVDCIGREVNQLYRGGDLAALRARFGELAADTGAGVADTVRLGLSAYRLADLLLAEKEKRPARKAVARAVERLETVWERAEDPEVGALLSLLYGTQIRMQPFKGMFLGDDADRVTRRAVELAPENPRVRLAEGVGLLYKPRAFGGSKEKAVEALRRASALFDREPPGAVCWGSDDAELQLAQAHLELGQRDEAAAAARRVLARHPDHVWALRLLERLAPDR